MLSERLPWMAEMAAKRERMLVLTHESRVAAFRAHAPEARVVTDEASLRGVDGSFDAAVIDRFLERERWDRWVLQRIHRLLRMDAPLVLIVPALLSFRSAVDVAFLGYVARRLERRLLGRSRHREEAPDPVNRRYHLPRLVRKLASVGFTAIETRSFLRGRATLMARKAPARAGEGDSPWPDAELEGRWYAEQYASIAAASRGWLVRFPALKGLVATPLEPADWRDARVLVLAPHPDDELVGCGGTLCRLLAAGASVTILQATDGAELASLRGLAPQQRRRVRQDEARRVAAALGARLVLWPHEDARLQCGPDTVAELARLLRELRPSHVFTPFLADLHADHRAISRILREALGNVPLRAEVLQYEVWGRVPANLYCEVGEVAADLEELLLLYERAMQVDDFVHFCARRNALRGRELTGRAAQVEAFLSTTVEAYRELA